MHLLRTETRTLDEAAVAVDLAQSGADIVFLSFSDSDLGAFSSAWDAGDGRYPSLRVASLAQLKHPYSVDLYLAKMAPRARFVLVRLLGGLDYWRYGVDELAAAARANGFHLAIVPGDHRPDERLDAASTLAPEDLRRLWGWFAEGGPDNLAQSLAFIASRIGRPVDWREPQPVASMGVSSAHAREATEDAPRALVLFYRSILLSSDTAPIAALADALASRGFAVTAAFVMSLKDRAAAEGLAGLLAREPPDVILNTTAFSGRTDEGPCVLDVADAPVLQVILAGSSIEAWRGTSRGLSAADLAMNVVLPEIDGRIITRAISFKAEAKRHDGVEFAHLTHRPDSSRVNSVADLAAAWARLRRTPASHRTIACVLSDYPHKGGRTGYAIGLDTPASVVAIGEALRGAGYDVSKLPESASLMRALTEKASVRAMSLALYRELFAELPADFQNQVTRAWGDPQADAALAQGAFQFNVVRAGNLIVAVQPERGASLERKTQYHDVNLPPRHSYVAFYLWLRRIENVHALVHCGAHGTLEWLPGKAVALEAGCAPEAVLGAVPLIYPFIVNNPGEAAQAKRRLAAVIVGHLTPPLVDAGAHGAAAEIEALFDEYANASALDPPRARLLARAILARASETGLAQDAGLDAEEDPDAALRRLDGWICDLKDMRIADGLHVFGRELSEGGRAAMIASFADQAGADGENPEARLDACAAGEMAGLLRALDGRFVEPGPAGAPSRGRYDVLPTGRNLFSVDPRGVPTRTAWEIGRAAARDVLTRYVQDHGDWPKAIVLDLWGSATMRTGGDDLAQALALIGAKPVWDHASSRVSGFEIEPCATLGRPRVDVTLRISGLFRDVFPQQVVLFDEAVRAIAALDEENEDNPLAAARRSNGCEPVRVFGAARGGYGVGLGRTLAEGRWESRDELAKIYLSSSSHAYSRDHDGVRAEAEFEARVASADAFVHVQDMAEQDVLDSGELAEHEAGFAAAAASLGATPALYHVDSATPRVARVRTLKEEVARVLRARATNPRWLAGRMRHGYRGAADIAETVDNLFAFAALADVVESRHFDLMFEAACGDERVRCFLIEANPQAARAIAEKFDEALRRGFWRPRRNSTDSILAELRGGS